MKKLTFLLIILLFLAAACNIFGQTTSYPFEVKKTGKGNRSLIFIPGFASSGEVWNETTAKFEKNFTCYTLAMAGSSAEEIAYILGHSSVVTARHYIFSTPELAQIRAQALGKNSLYKQMIAMLLTGRLVYKKDWLQKKVLGNIGSKIHYDIGGCSYEDKCLFQPVRNCYGCIYFHPFIDANHTNVLESIQCEINDLIRLSDGIGISRNPLIRVHESTKFEIESVIVRCKIQKDDINES